MSSTMCELPEKPIFELLEYEPTDALEFEATCWFGDFPFSVDEQEADYVDGKSRAAGR